MRNQTSDWLVLAVSVLVAVALAFFMRQYDTPTGTHPVVEQPLPDQSERP